MGYTVTGATHEVIQWSDVSNEVFLLDGNVALPLTIISDCKYCNYIHEVTLSSSSTDNDAIGIVLASLRDELGLYGPINHTHNLILFFTNQTSAAGVTLQFNYGDRTHAFVQGEAIRYCGNPASPCTTAYSGYSSVVTTRPTANSPFGVAGYAAQGSVRVRIEEVVS